MATSINADANVGPLAFSVDGKSIHGLCQDLKVRTWNVATGALQATLTFDKDDSPSTLTAVVQLICAAWALAPEAGPKAAATTTRGRSESDLRDLSIGRPY